MTALGGASESNSDPALVSLQGATFIGGTDFYFGPLPCWEEVHAGAGRR